MPWFALGIEITADDLKPGEITSLLGVCPTHQHERGELILRRDGTPRPPPKSGRWAFRLEASETNQWNANQAVQLFTGTFTADPNVWKAIASDATVSLTLALLLENANQGFSLDPDVLRWLADRNIRLDIDIYEGNFEPETGDPVRSDRETSH